MGSFCVLLFDTIEVISVKSHIPDYLISLFQEEDRKTLPNKYSEEMEDCDPDIVYQTKREILLSRLDLMGFTIDAAKNAFQNWKNREIEFYSDHEVDTSLYEKELESLRTFDIEEWMKRVPQVLQKKNDSVVDFIDKKLAENSEESWLYFNTSDPRFNIRLILESMHNVSEIILDISDLIHGGYLNDKIRLCSTSKAPEAIGRHILEPVVIMAEGKSDIRVLKESIGVLFPQFVEYFSFLDHRELNVDGGASYLTKFLKAFSSARISSLMVALFDNDAAGTFERDKALQIGVSDNFLILRFPAIDIARDYPTIGPQGMHAMDINGSACGIEMYLGKQNLLNEDTNFMPIKWTQYFAQSGTYQGELLDKEKVQDRFFSDIASVSDASVGKSRFPELTLLWEMIFKSVSDANSNSVTTLDNSSEN